MKSFRTVLLAGALLFTARSARADFDAEKRQSDLSAFNMNRGELRLGLFQEEYAFLDAWAIGTYLVPWIAAPFVGLVNFYTKVELFDLTSPSGERTALALATRFFWVDISNVGFEGMKDDRFRAVAVPTSLALSRVFSERVTLTLEGTYVPVGVLGDVASKDTGFFGTAAQSNVQLAAIGEYRLNRNLAINLVVRVAPWVEPLRLTSTLDIDEDTTAELEVEFHPRRRSRPILVQPGFTATWGNFWIQAGLGYGNLFLPGIRMVGHRRLRPRFRRLRQVLILFGVAGARVREPCTLDSRKLSRACNSARGARGLRRLRVRACLSAWPQSQIAGLPPMRG